MSKYIILILTIIILSCNNQNSDDNLNRLFQRDLDTYTMAMNEKRWDDALNMMYPEIFEYAPKEDMVNIFISMEENGMVIQTTDISVKNISQIITFNGLNYCKLDYQGHLNIDISGEMLTSIDFLKENFNREFGAENVNYNNNAFSIDATRSMIAISEANTQNWKYLEFNPQSMQLIASIIPVLDQLLLNETAVTE